MLQDEYDNIDRTLQSGEWNGLKDELSEEMSAGDFWNRADCFDTLARFALLDRVKAAAETADVLRRRLEKYNRSPPRYSAELSGRLALQLHLIREGIKDAFDNAPVELVFAIEPVFDGAGDRSAMLCMVRSTTIDVSRLGRQAPHADHRSARQRHRQKPSDPDRQRVWRPSRSVAGSRAARFRAV
jgi:hypothetical protein